MSGSLLVALALAVAGAVVLVAGLMAVRSSGAMTGMARRLAGARQHRVGELDGLALPSRRIRVAGRIRCPDPIVTDEDERLVAYHRDVEVQLADGRWQRIERERDTRAFELWDHAASQRLDPAQAAEPLVVIPHVWRGRPDELTDAGHVSALARLRAQGAEPVAARSVTRMLSVVERLLVLTEVERDDAGRVRLRPPAGGYVITALELPDAMRLLGGRHRRRLVAGAALVAVGVLLLAAGAGVGLWAALAGALAG